MDQKSSKVTNIVKHYDILLHFLNFPVKLQRYRAEKTLGRFCATIKQNSKEDLS